MNSKLKNVIVLAIIIMFIFGRGGQVVAVESRNLTPMYNGYLIAYVKVNPGYWASEAEYTGTKPLGLKDLLLQSQIVRRNGTIVLYQEWATKSLNGNKWFVRDTGVNAEGPFGQNYARAIGYHWAGGLKAVATSYI